LKIIDANEIELQRKILWTGGYKEVPKQSVEMKIEAVISDCAKSSAHLEKLKLRTLQAGYKGRKVAFTFCI
jgi:hypothetical protein